MRCLLRWRWLLAACVLSTAPVHAAAALDWFTAEDWPMQYYGLGNDTDVGVARDETGVNFNIREVF